MRVFFFHVCSPSCHMGDNFVFIFSIEDSIHNKQRKKLLNRNDVDFSNAIIIKEKFEEKLLKGKARVVIVIVIVN